MIQEILQLYMGLTQGSDPVMISDRMTVLMERYITSINGVMSSLFSLVTLILTPVLTMGLLASLIRLLRGEAVQPSDVLCRRNLFLRSLWLSILTGLKTIAWALPGFAVMLVGSISLFISFSSASLGLFSLATLVGYGLMMVLMIRALLHYALSNMILADHPEMTAGQAIKESIGCMKTRKAAFFVLQLSFIGWILLNSVLTSVASQIWSVLGLVVDFALGLGLTLYINTATAAFYLHEYCGSEFGAQEPISPVNDDPGSKQL